MRNLFISILILSLAFVSCKKHPSKENTEETHIPVEYSRMDTLSLLADSLGKYRITHPEWDPTVIRYGFEELDIPVFNFVLDWEILPDSLLVRLAIHTEEIITGFRQEILASPLIRFRKSSPRVPFTEYFFSDYQEGSCYGYELHLSQNSFTRPLPATVTATIFNHTDTDASTGSRYWIEYKHNGTWEVISFLFNNGAGMGFPDIGYFLLSHSKHAYTIHLYPDLYNYQPGEYRISRSFWIPGHYTEKGRTKTWQNYFVSASFTIQ